MPHSDHDSPSPTEFKPFADLPSFPDTVPTAPLLRISLEKLLAGDKEEEERCWQASCELGFFYLDLQGTNIQENGTGGDLADNLLQDTDQLFDIMKGFFDMAVEEKVKYDFKDQGSYFGYKGYGAGIVDAKGTKDKNEFYNISKDDILGLSAPLPSPFVLNSHRALYTSFIRAAHNLCMLVTALLSPRLDLKPSVRNSGGLQAFHKLDARSGDQIRFVKAPPQEQDSKAVALGEHTDFGSVTVLFNRLGGLQVRLPEHIKPIPSSASVGKGSENELCKNGWAYVRPIPGHCIINLGDALVKFSAGKVRSNIHRVVQPPGKQSQETRYSLVYFCRPEDDVILESLINGADGEEDTQEEKITAKDWILRRALGRRGEAKDWEKSNGTEQVSLRGEK